METKFVWDERYSVNDPEIDKQHKFIFSLGNKIKDLVKEDVIELALELRQHFKIHFDYEENHMRKIGFPQLNEHIKLHTELTNNFNEFLSNFLDSKNTLDDFQNLLYSWVIDHVLTDDIQYFNYYRNKQKESSS